MKPWKRIVLVSTLIVGSTATFALWSFKQFDNALATLSAPPQVAIIFKARPQGIRLGAAPSGPTRPVIATSSPIQEKKSVSTQVFSIDPPGNGGKVYIGCTYPLDWQYHKKVTALEAVLFNAGTQTAIAATTSGLAKAHTVSPATQQISWKVGGVWPGVYYLSLPKINGTSLEERSSTFIIYAMPVALESDEQKSLCESSGGTL